MSIIDDIRYGAWEVRRTIWPYKEGWGVYHPRSHTVLDTGLPKEEAQARCDELNKHEFEKRGRD